MELQQPKKRGGQIGNRGGQVGRSGRRIASVSTLDKLVSLAETKLLRGIRDSTEDLHTIAKDLALPIVLKRIADRHESVVVNLSVSDQLMAKVMERLGMQEAAEIAEPNDVYIIPEPNEPNEPNDTNAPSRDPVPPTSA